MSAAHKLSQYDPELVKEVENLYKEEKRKQRELLIEKIIQKALGICCFILGTVAPFLLEGDATLSIVFYAIGAAYIISKS